MPSIRVRSGPWVLVFFPYPLFWASVALGLAVYFLKGSISNLVHLLCSPILKQDLHEEKKQGLEDTQQWNALVTNPNDQNCITETHIKRPDEIPGICNPSTSTLRYEETKRSFKSLGSASIEYTAQWKQEWPWLNKGEGENPLLKIVLEPSPTHVQ